MRIAAFGDIHSNHIALEACLAKLEQIEVDGIVFLGDYVSDCAYPQKTLELMREAAKRYRCWFIRGNREEYMIDHADGKSIWKNNSQSGSVLYTYENLTQDDIEWFRSLPISMKVEIEDAPPFEICHGGHYRSRLMLLPGREEFDEELALMETDLMLCAHTHETFICEKDGKAIANGGCVGLPSKGQTGASFILLELTEGKWVPQLIRVDYDVEAVIREFHESGFMDRGHVWARAVTKSLRTGQYYTLQCIELVNQYAKETAISFEEETLWQRAAEVLEL